MKHAPRTHTTNTEHLQSQMMAVCEGLLDEPGSHAFQNTEPGIQDFSIPGFGFQTDQDSKSPTSWSYSVSCLRVFFLNGHAYKDPLAYVFQATTVPHFHRSLLPNVCSNRLNQSESPREIRQTVHPGNPINQSATPQKRAPYHQLSAFLDTSQ